MKKKSKIIIGAVAGVAALGIIAGGIAIGVTYTPPVELKFGAPSLTGDDAVTVPASGSTKRDVTAKLYNNKAFDEDGNPAVLEDAVLTYALDKEIEGVTLDGTMLTISSAVKADDTLTVTATAEQNGKTYTKKLKVDIDKDESLKDTPANPLEKEGYTLVFNDEFDGDSLDFTKWSPYYLRNWVDNDARTKADYYFEDGALVLRNNPDDPSWSSQNDNVKVRGIMSYEKSTLHKFGTVGSGAVFSRDIPTFDGYATKYGYFEVRMRMPDTNDGSHFAWWMVGVQGDENVTSMLEGDTERFQSHYSNETGEIDIIETYLSPLENMKAWRPVIHPNGTTSYQYHWLPQYTIPGDPSAEYHVYGFEWDENGTKFYVDGQLASESDRSPNYPMMTFFTTYAAGGMGSDRGIYPKDTYIDYFRVYKKTEAPRATNVVLNNGNMPDFIRVPDSGSSTVQLTAQATDQFDQPIQAQIKWKLSETVDGFLRGEHSAPAQVPGVTIDENTGLITVDSTAREGADLFVTAYVDEIAKQTYHVKLSKDPSAPLKVLFDDPIALAQAGSYQVRAAVYDQYGQRMDSQVRYTLSEDIAANKQVTVPGVTLTSDGQLTITAEAKQGTSLVITARGGGRYNSIPAPIGS